MYGYQQPARGRAYMGRGRQMPSYQRQAYRCSCCLLTMPTKAEIQEHEAAAHYWCSECQRGFQSYNNTKMHLNSEVHRGKTIKCPFCTAHYTTVAGLAHHVESGSCPNASGLDRDEVYRMVRRADPSGSFTNNLIGWTGSVTYIASELAWNGQYYECYFCHNCFNSLHSLNQHLKSPTHQQKLYHCPGRACRKEFTSLAGLCNHLESETCGFMRFETVQSSFQNVVNAGRLLSYDD